MPKRRALFPRSEFQCLSPPLDIPDGYRYSTTLRVFAGDPGSNFHPQFQVDVLDGTYRLRWDALCGAGSELPAALKTSSQFLLDDPR